MHEAPEVRSPDEVDLRETRRRFLLAREQAAAQESARYVDVCAMREWPAPEPAGDDLSAAAG